MPGPGGGPSHGSCSGAGQPIPNPNAPTGPAVITGLSGSTSTAYFRDQYGNPRWAWVDAVWPVVYSAGAEGGAATYQSVMSSWLSTRASQGYTGFENNLLPNNEYGTFGTAGNNVTWDGVHPFVTGVDPGSGLNSTYWTRVDYLVNTAAGLGMTCFMNLLMGEDLASGVAGAWTSTQKTQFG